LIFILTATNVLAANQSSSAYAAGGGNDASSSYINGQGQMGKIKFNSSGGGYGFYEKSCPTGTTYGPAIFIPADGGSVDQPVPMTSDCKYKLHITSGVFPVAGTIQNYS